MARHATHGAEAAHARATGARRAERSEGAGLRRLLPLVARDLTGPVQKAGAREIQKLELSPADVQLVRAQGAFVNADRVSAAK